jgi:anti-sigma28 factor (negative regulator of flagellin synthesis)
MGPRNRSARANADDQRLKDLAIKGAAMLATLNSRQIVDAIVKDTMKDNDPHDAVQISSDVVLASRAHSDAPTLAPEITNRPEPKIDVAAPPAPTTTAAPSVDTAIRVAANDVPGREKPSAVGRWLRGAFITMLFAGGSAAATIVWESHGDTARQMLAEWTPSLTSLMPSTSPATPVATVQAATDQTTDQSAAPPAAQDAPAAAAVSQPDATQSLQSMTRDVAAMAQQIAQLKANIAELKTAQDQMAREMVKTPAPKPVADAKPIDPRARVSALPPRPPVAPVRKPKPITTPAYPQTYAPTQIAPPLPSPQAVAVPPPPAAAAQAVADDDGPVVRPPMPVH